MVDPDADALTEYARRLRESYHAVPDGASFWVPPKGSRSEHWLEIVVHRADALRWAERSASDPGRPSRCDGKKKRPGRSGR